MHFSLFCVNFTKFTLSYCIFGIYFSATIIVLFNFFCQCNETSGCIHICRSQLGLKTVNAFDSAITIGCSGITCNSIICRQSWMPLQFLHAKCFQCLHLRILKHHWLQLYLHPNETTKLECSQSDKISPICDIKSPIGPPFGNPVHKIHKIPEIHASTDQGCQEDVP